MRLRVFQLIALLALIELGYANIVTSAHHPNVIIMHISNLLWSDLGIHVNQKDSENSTPNIDYLAYSGTILNRFYANGGINSLLSGCHIRSQYSNPNLMKTYFERNGYNVNFVTRSNFDKIEEFERGVLDAITNDNDPFLAVVDFGHLGTDINIPFVDEIVASTVTRAHQLDVLKDTIILFLSLPDSRDSPLEINIRRTAFIYSPLLKLQQRVSNQMLHIIDLLPTLVNATSLQWRTRDRIFIDGVNQWQALNENEERRLNVYGDNFFINNNWKLSLGASGALDFYGSIANENMESDKDMTDYDFSTYASAIFSSEVHLVLNKLSPERIMYIRARARVHCNLKDIDESAVNNIKCSPSEPCLFDLFEDPCEFDNKHEQEFDVRREQMRAAFQRLLNGEKIDEVSVKSTNVEGEAVAKDGTLTGVILGSSVLAFVGVFLVIVCIKEQCINKRDVYNDKPLEPSKSESGGWGNESSPNGNGISVISHSSKL